MVFRLPSAFLQKKWFPGYVVLASILLAACAGPGFGGSSTPGTATSTSPAQSALSKLHWCGKPLMVFRDEGASSTPGATAGTAMATATPKTLTDWSQVKSALGFTIFLPTALASGTCLMSASGTLHDPVFGSSFTIGYLLPDRSAISLAEAPLRSQKTALQCSQATTTTSDTGTPAAKPGVAQMPLLLCSGAREKTNIVFSARGTKDSLAQFFQGLRPDVNWIPVSK